MHNKQLRTIVILSLFISAFWIYKSLYSKLNKTKIVLNPNEQRFIQNFILTPSYKLCTTKPFIVIIVTSDVRNVNSRRSLRSAMPRTLLKSMNTTKMFLLAKIPPHEQLLTQRLIEKENEIYEDILQGSFIENYRNLTNKHLMGLQWASEQCSDASYILKVDDDTVFDLKKLFRLLTGIKTDGDFLLGYMQNNTRPQRNKKNKWYVSWEEYSSHYYPSFLSGWYYITTPTTAGRLSNEAMYHPHFWIDDVLITGLLPEALNIKLIQLPEEFWFEYTNNCILHINRLGLGIQ